MAAAKTYYGTGRRKSAVARVWLFAGQKGFKVNGRELPEYLRRKSLEAIAGRALQTVELASTFRVRASVAGGGISGQAGALSLGIARALVNYDEKLRPKLRKGGFLTRDPREKERKKYGRKGARRRFQYTKR